MLELTKRFIGCERAATSIEYGVIAGGVLTAVIAATGLLGGSVANLFNYTANEATIP